MLLVFFCSCQISHYIPENQVYYKKYSIIIQDLNKREKNKLRNELKEFVNPKPSGGIFGMSLKNILYLKLNKHYVKKHYFIEKYASPPLYIEQLNVIGIANSMKVELFDKGYFDAQVNWKINQKNKSGELLFEIKTGQVKIVDKLVLNIEDTSDLFSINLLNEFKKLEFPTGKPFNLNQLIKFRQELALQMKNKGYYYFDSEMLIFLIDTSLANNRLNLKMKLKEKPNNQFKNLCQVRKVNLNWNYTKIIDNEQTDLIFQKNIQKQGFKSDTAIFDTEFLYDIISFKPNETYSWQKQEDVLNKLVNLGVFKFVNLTFQMAEMDSLKNSEQLDLTINLFPLKRKLIQAELSTVTKTNNFAGPGIDLSFKNRNCFKKAESYTLKLKSGFETQLTSYRKNLVSYLLGVDQELIFPSIWFPFINRNNHSILFPKTIIKSGLQILDRVNFYRLSALNFNYGFNWRKNSFYWHEFNPICLNMVILNQKSNAFNALLNFNSILKKSFENQLIASGNYNLVFNNQISTSIKNHFFFNVNLEASGNTFYFFKNIFDKNIKTENKIFLNFPFSHYVRSELDFRFYPQLTSRFSLALKFLFGVGKALGNSLTLPYLKQFYVGGPNSLRAFLPRSVGPGSSPPIKSIAGNLFVDQTGDLKIESSIEKRININRIFRAALFLDAGNIWQLHEDQYLKGGSFQFKSFISEIALGSGVGLRMDFKYFLLRLDLAFPLKKPYDEFKNRWLLKNMEILNPNWRRENLVFNLAIGYPF